MKGRMHGIDGARKRMDARLVKKDSCNLVTRAILADVDGERKAVQPTLEELHKKFMELRRAYLSFEKFIKDCGIEI